MNITKKVVIGPSINVIYNDKLMFFSVSEKKNKNMINNKTLSPFIDKCVSDVCVGGTAVIGGSYSD